MILITWNYPFLSLNRDVQLLRLWSNNVCVCAHVCVHVCMCVYEVVLLKSWKKRYLQQEALQIPIIYFVPSIVLNTLCTWQYRVFTTILWGIEIVFPFHSRGNYSIQWLSKLTTITRLMMKESELKTQISLAQSLHASPPLYTTPCQWKRHQLLCSL